MCGVALPVTLQFPLESCLQGALWGDLKGKGGKGEHWSETRSCWTSEQKGHLRAKCTKKKGDGSRGDGKGKGQNVHGLSEVSDSSMDEAIALGSLMKSLPSTSLQAASVGGESWGAFRKIEATLDSGAAECVCGANHFPDQLLVEPTD